MNFLETLIISIITAISAYLGGFLSNKRNIKRDNINIQRERLLKNINKAEDYLHLLIEKSLLQGQILKFKEFIETLDSNITLLENETTKNSEQIKFLNNELKKDLEEEQRKKYLYQLDIAKSEKKALASRVAKIRHRLDGGESDLNELATTTENLKNRLIDIDIEPTLYLIDPSGQISRNMSKLENIYDDQGKVKSSSKNIIDLRLKINDLFDEKIKELK